MYCCTASICLNHSSGLDTDSFVKIGMMTLFIRSTWPLPLGTSVMVCLIP